MRGSRFGKGIALVLVAATGALSAGCFGKFQLTRKVYDMNKAIDDTYVRSATTWVFVIVPVYEVAALLDLIVFNVIEFWTGENPSASAPVTKVYAQGNGRTVLNLSRDGSATVAVIERYEGERLVSTLRVRDDGAGKVTAIETAAGKEVRKVVATTASDGSVDVTVATAAGTGTVRYAAAAVGAQRTRAARIASEVAQASRGPLPPSMAPAALGHPLPSAISGEAAAARIPAYGG